MVFPDVFAREPQRAVHRTIIDVEPTWRFVIGSADRDQYGDAKDGDDQADDTDNLPYGHAGFVAAPMRCGNSRPPPCVARPGYVGSLPPMRAALAIAAMVLALPAQAESGIASVYGGSDGYCGKPVAAGGVLDCRALTGAHRRLPFGTIAKVTNTDNRRSIAVRITDRGPFVKGRIIDLTPAAAAALGCPGLCPVVVEVITWAPTADLFRGAQ